MVPLGGHRIGRVTDGKLNAGLVMDILDIHYSIQGRSRLHTVLQVRMTNPEETKRRSINGTFLNESLGFRWAERSIKDELRMFDEWEVGLQNVMWSTTKLS